MQKLMYWCWLPLLVIGCGAAYESAQTKAPATGEVAGEGVADNANPAIAENQQAEEQTEGERKIIYEGRLSLVVEDFQAMETAIPDLVKQFKGYLKEANINRTEGRWRSGRWVARIPAERFPDFLVEAAKLGIAEQQEQTAQDVTMEYLDLEARIKAKQELEQRILKLLENRDGKLSDVVEAERELSRIRSDIESMQGQLRYLKNRTSFSTVTIDVREEQDYIPEAAPDLGGRVGKAWQQSLKSLKFAGENLLIGVVAFVPWILPLGVLGLVVTLLGRKLLRWKKTPQPKS